MVITTKAYNKSENIEVKDVDGYIEAYNIMMISLNMYTMITRVYAEV